MRLKRVNLSDPPMAIAMEPWLVRQNAAGATWWQVTWTYHSNSLRLAEAGYLGCV